MRLFKNRQYRKSKVGATTDTGGRSGAKAPWAPGWHRWDTAIHSLPVTLPRSEKRVAPISPERIRHLRQHLIDVILDLRGPEAEPSTAATSEPDGFVKLVTRAACALCKGVCCSHGGDHGYIDIEALTRFRLLHSWLSAEKVVMMYLGRIPHTAYRDSCIFHGKKGCTLDRSMRSDVCNSYFCGGLRAYIDSGCRWNQPL